MIGLIRRIFNKFFALNKGMNMSPTGLDLTKSFEGGPYLKAYQDIVGIWTIGYGTTKNVVPGMVITLEQAEEFLKRDVAEAEVFVSKAVTVALLQQQFDALVDFAYNLGIGALKNSTLLKVLNYGQYDQAADEFLKWDHAGGKRVLGLTRRRKSERILFKTGVLNLNPE